MGALVDAGTSDRLVLHPIDEREALRAYSTIAELLGEGVDRGRCEILPGSELQASAWHAGAVGSRGGDCSPEWWSDDPVIPSMTVNLFRVRDAYYAPGFGVIISATGEAMWSTMVEAVYLTPDLTLLPYTERVGDETTLNVPREIETLDQVVVSMPWGALFNYGHFVLDCLPTVASVAEFPELGGYRFVFPPLEPWQRRHLQLLGVDEPLELDQPLYHVTDVVFTSCMSSFLHSPNVNYRTVREKQLARKTSTSIAYDKVYITRLGDPKRTFLSERALADRLESLGFAIVAPENHTIDEQIDIFGNANVIVGCAGAAFANALYCHGGATVVEITPIRMVMPKKLSGVWVSNICAIVGCNWRPYYCRDDPQDQPILVAGLERPEIGFSFDLDIDDLVGYIDRLMQG